MILGFDHVVLVVADLEAAIAAYEALLGRTCQWRGEDDGAAHAWFRLGNMALSIQARSGPGRAGEGIASRLATSGEGLGAIVFAVADIGEARRLLQRRGLASSSPRTLALTHAAQTERLLLAGMAADATHGVPMGLAQRIAGEPTPDALSPAIADEGATMSALDHVVIRSPCPERAIALLAGRLDLELRLDRSNPDWGARLLFFRCGDLVVEVAHDLAAGVTDGADDLWGLSWRTPDLDATHARLAAAGLAVSDIRAGRRPGTRVFTIKDRSARVPTLVLGREA
jgi:catechol 2,3-dioxygenase-like lactoylglutathione lyase family enzyme